MLRWAPLLLLVALFPQPALASEGGGPSWKMLGLHVLNFSFLLFLLYRYARPAVLEFLRERSRGIRQDIESAEDRLRAAEAEIAQLRTRLSDLDAESAHIVSSTTEQAELEKARAFERAAETSRRIQEDAQRVAAQETERARQALRAEAGELATQLAAELLRENLTAEDDQRLVQEFTERVGGSQ
jgi:F-type H+-transporting ATPase subunit b